MYQNYNGSLPAQQNTKYKLSVIFDTFGDTGTFSDTGTDINLFVHK